MNLKAGELILLETPHLIAINKPSGLLSIPDRKGEEISVKSWLQQHYESVYTVHRIDRDTSGVVIFARSPEAHRFLSMQFEQRETEKTYNGLVLGLPVPEEDTIDAPIAEHSSRPGVMVINRRGKQSITEYKVLENFRFYSWMEFNILTGRTHQIRLHMKSVGHPIVCDDVYGDGQPVLLSRIKTKFNLSKNEEAERPLLNRLALHAAKLTIKSPGGELLQLEAPLPKDLSATLNQLRKQKK